MPHLSSQANHFVLPAQVWPALASDLQADAVWLLAQLAFNLVTAQAEQPSEEVSDASSSQQSQNPSGSS